MKKKSRLLLLGGCMLLVSCAATPQDKVRTDQNVNQMQSNVAVNNGIDVEFPLPAVPDDLRDTDSRLAYVLEHFWDNFDFADTTLVNQTVAEQGISNFANLMQYAQGKVADDGMRCFVRHAMAGQWQIDHYSKLAEMYFYADGSPVRSDVVYANYLRRRLEDASSLDEAVCERFKFLLSAVDRNQPGTLAADFEYTDRTGNADRLYNVYSPFTVLFFHDPDCETCQSIFPIAINDAMLQRDGIRVLAVYPDSDLDLWKKEARQLPANWTDCRSTLGDLRTSLTYYLPAMPSFYLLDAEKNVILKDVTLEQLDSMIAQLGI